MNENARSKYLISKVFSTIENENDLVLIATNYFEKVHDIKVKCNEIELSIIFLISQNFDWMRKIIAIICLH